MTSPNTLDQPISPGLELVLMPTAQIHSIRLGEGAPLLATMLISHPRFGMLRFAWSQEAFGAFLSVARKVEQDLILASAQPSGAAS